MISQFYILSLRGNVIISRDFRGDMIKGTAEIFYRNIMPRQGFDKFEELAVITPLPIFLVNGIIFIYLKRNGLYFVLTTLHDTSPSYCMELLNQVIKVLKDFCGSVNEMTVKQNFVLIYEIIDEMLDAGYPQSTHVEQLKLYINNEVLLTDSYFKDRNASFRNNQNNSLSKFVATSVRADETLYSPHGICQRTVPSSASNRPITNVPVVLNAIGNTPNSKRLVSQKLNHIMSSIIGKTPTNLEICGLNNNEIFVDILERISLVMDSLGNILNFALEGCIQMKTFMTNNCNLVLALNEHILFKEYYKYFPKALSSGDDGAFLAESLPGHVLIDDVNFHDCVDTTDFYKTQVLYVKPPAGEFIIMNYRITNHSRSPFKIRQFTDRPSPYKLDLTIEIRADIPTNNYGANMKLSCTVPRSAMSVCFDSIPRSLSKTAEFLKRNNQILWKVKKMQGGSEMIFKARITLCEGVSSHQVSSKDDCNMILKQLGPVNLSFEIPMFILSNIQVKYLRLLDVKNTEISKMQSPLRWVRYLTQSSSYICRNHV